MKLFDVYPLYDITPVSGKGSTVVDDKGREYLDFYGGHAVISIGHAHPHYVKRVQEQVAQLGFYSNAIINPLQQELAQKLGEVSGCGDYNLFMVNSGAEANENALKLASFKTGRARMVSFANSFHGRTSAAVAATDDAKINAPLNQQQQVTFLQFEDVAGLEAELAKGDVCAVILETIQGIGGLDEPTTAFYKEVERLCKTHGSFLIADEIQCGYGRSGSFFAFQQHGIHPDIITIAKGMGNGFPVGGVLIHESIEASYGLLGTTFGGNHLACAASLAVLEVLEQEQLVANTAKCFDYFKTQAAGIPQIKKVKGKGLMLGLEFDFEVADLRKRLIYNQAVFTGGAKNKKLLRILPALNITTSDIDAFFNALKQEL